MLIRTDSRCIRVIIIAGFRKVIASPYKPDCDDKSHLTLKGILDVDLNTNSEDHGPFECIYVMFGTDFCVIHVFLIMDSVYSHNSQVQNIISCYVKRYPTIIYHSDID